MAFSNKKDYNFALFEGPWMVADHYLIVQRWRPFFLMNAKITNKVAMWIKIQHLPIELYNNINLLHHCWVAYQLHTVLPFVPHYSSTKTYRVKTFILQIKLEPTNINMSFKRFLKVLLHAYSHEFSSRVN